MIRRKQATALGDNAMAVVVGVAGKGDVVFVLEPDQSLHRVFRGGIHANVAVPVHRHESELRIDLVADYIQLQFVVFCNPRPIVHAGTTEWVDTQAQAGTPDRVEVHDVAKVGDIRAKIVMRMRGVGLARLGIGDALDSIESRFEQAIGFILNPAGDVAVGWPAIGRVVFEAAIVGRIVRGRNDDAVGECVRAATVVDEDGVGDRWRRRVLAVGGYHDSDAVGGEYFQRAGKGGRGERMRVESHKQGAVDSLFLAVAANRLADRQHVILIEAVVQRRSAMPGGSKRDALRRLGGIGFAGVIRRHQSWHIDKDRAWCGFSGKRIDMRTHDCSWWVWVPSVAARKSCATSDRRSPMRARVMSGEGSSFASFCSAA